MYKKTALFLVLTFFAAINANKLDSEYSKEFTDLVELVYGSEFLSLGSTDSVDLMFNEETLDNKKLFDIGAGLGGVDFYLANNFNVNITAIDRVFRLVEEANKRKANHKLKGEVNFFYQDTDTDLSKYNTDYFDIVFAKESLLHIADKNSILKEVFRILKPSGKLIILDWMLEKDELGPNIKKMMEIDSLDLKMSTVTDCQKQLSEQGFNLISTSNLKSYSIAYTNNSIERIKSRKSDIIKQFGENTYEYSLKSWGVQKTIFENNEVVFTLIKAIKPEINERNYE